MDGLTHDPAQHAWILPDLKRVHVVSGIGLMYGDDGHPGSVVRTQTLGALLRCHRIVDRSQHQSSLQTVVELTDTLESAERRRAPHRRWRVYSNDMFALGQCHDLLVAHEGLRRIHLLLIGLLDVIGSRMIILETFVDFGPVLSRLDALGDLLRQRLGLFESP